MKYVIILICALVIIGYFYARASSASRKTPRSNLKTEASSNDDAGPAVWLGASSAEYSGHSSGHHASGHADCGHGGDHGGGGDSGGGDGGGSGH